MNTSCSATTLGSANNSRGGIKIANRRIQVIQSGQVTKSSNNSNKQVVKVSSTSLVTKHRYNNSACSPMMDQFTSADASQLSSGGKRSKPMKFKIANNNSVIIDGSSGQGAESRSKNE